MIVWIFLHVREASRSVGNYTPFRAMAVSGGILLRKGSGNDIGRFPWLFSGELTMNGT